MRSRLPRVRRRALAALLAAAAIALLAATAFGGSGEDKPATASASDSTPAASRDTPAPRPQVVDVIGPGDDPDDVAPLPEARGPAPRENASDPGAPSPSAPSDADVEAELAQLKKHAGGNARLSPDGQAIAPFDAPPSVQRIIAAGNIISRSPYKWGGGHGRWLDDGYDCSGSVSFALAAAGLMQAPLVSGQLASWGSAGRGRWVTIYAHDGHVYMEVAGLRFDTSGRDSRTGGSRWQAARRSGSGFEVRHPPGL